MPRNITVTFGDGTTHVYQNAPDDVTPDQVHQRAESEFKKPVVSLDGGRQAPAEKSPPTAPPRDPTTRERVKPYVTPVAEGLGMGLGAIAGAVPGTLVAPVAGTAGGAVVGGGLGYAGVKELERLMDENFGSARPMTLPQAAGNAAKNVAVGGAWEMGGQIAIPAAMRAAGWVWDQGGGRLVQIKAGKVMREIAGDKLAQIRSALAQAAPGETAGQAVAGAGVAAPTFQAMERRAAAELPEQFGDIHAAQEAARLQGMQAVTPDLKAAEAARTAAAQPFYKQADAAVTSSLSKAVDRAGQPLFARPALRDALKAAETTAANQGVKMYDSNGNLTGIGVHLVKTELDDAAGAIARTTAAKNATNGINSAKDEFLTWVKNSIPEYDKGRAAFAAHSPPVNQSNIMTDLQGVLRNSVSGAERAGPFNTAVTTASERVVKRSGVPLGGRIENHLSTPQMDAVNRVTNELRRDAVMSSQATAGTNRLNDILGVSRQQTQIPNPLSAKITIVNRVLSAMQGRVNARTLRTLSEGMMQGRTALELLDAVPTHQRNALMRAFQENVNAGAGAPMNALMGSTDTVPRDEYVTR